MAGDAAAGGQKGWDGAYLRRSLPAIIFAFASSGSVSSISLQADNKRRREPRGGASGPKAEEVKGLSGGEEKRRRGARGARG